jgi:hypothetical protein
MAGRGQGPDDTIESSSTSEVAMRYAKDHKQATRQRIVEAAGRRFKQDGIDGAGVAAVMSDAGLTNGAFYAHLASKEDAAAGGLSTSVVVSPRSATTRSKRQGRASAPRGLTRRTHTSRPTNEADMRPHRICFQRLLTYSSTKKTCRSAPITTTSASTVCTMCHAS